jgi:hypothetical protein
MGEQGNNRNNREDIPMKKFITLGLVAALLAGSAGAAISEDALKAAGSAAAGAATDVGAAVDPTTTASIGTDFASLETSLNAGTMINLSTVTEASTVNFVTVSSLQGYDPAALDTSLSSKTEAMASLRTNVEANAALKAKLEAAGYSSDDVLAIQSGADGALTIYIDDRA